MKITSHGEVLQWYNDYKKIYHGDILHIILSIQMSLLFLKDIDFFIFFSTNALW